MPFASFNTKGLTKAQVPYRDVKSPVAITPLKSFGCLAWLTSPPSVTKVVPVIIPKYPLKIVRETTIVSHIG